jgi:hypothetical protein
LPQSWGIVLNMTHPSCNISRSIASRVAWDTLDSPLIWKAAKNYSSTSYKLLSAVSGMSSPSPQEAEHILFDAFIVPQSFRRNDRQPPCIRSKSFRTGYGHGCRHLRCDIFSRLCATPMSYLHSSCLNDDPLDVVLITISTRARNVP